MGLSTTTVGAFPKPARLLRARWLCAEEQIEAGELRAAEDAAVREVIRLQEQLGLDVLVDGQMDRGDMVGFFAGKVEGLEPGGLVRCFGNRYYRRPRVAGPLGWRAPLTVDRWSFASALSARPVKAVLTGPYTMMDWSFDEHYATRDECCHAFSDVVRREAEALLDAGATEIQIDEPAIGAREDEVEMAAKALESVTSGLRGRARIWSHICYGDLEPLLPLLLRLPVDVLMLELANSNLELSDALSHLPADTSLAAGVIDVLRPEVEEPRMIRERVAPLLERLPAERLWLAPDAGLRTLDEQSTRRKLEAMVAVAAEFS